jgi:hypothetical protein
LSLECFIKTVSRLLIISAATKELTSEEKIERAKELIEKKRKQKQEEEEEARKLLLHPLIQLQIQ